MRLGVIVPEEEAEEAALNVEPAPAPAVLAAHARSCDDLLAATSLRTALYTDPGAKLPSARGAASVSVVNSSSPQST